MTTNTTLQTRPQAMPLKARLESAEFAGQLARVLPKHVTAERMQRVALTALMRTPALAQCDQGSFFQAVLQCAALGLETDGRRAHLIPYGTTCQLIIDYKGLAELVMRSGLVSYLHADVVCDNDEFEADMGQIVRHKIDYRKGRGNAFAAYAVCKFKDGSTKCEVMGADEIEAIRKRSRSGGKGPWVTDWSEMAKKTVFRRLAKWLPLSPEIRDAAESDDDSPAPLRAIGGEVQTSVPISFAQAQLPQECAPESDPVMAPPPAGLTPQQELKAVMEQNGKTLAELLAWAKRHQLHSGAAASYDDLPEEVCDAILSNITNAIQAMQGGAK